MGYRPSLKLTDSKSAWKKKNVPKRVRCYVSYKYSCIYIYIHIHDLFNFSLMSFPNSLLHGGLKPEFAPVESKGHDLKICWALLRRLKPTAHGQRQSRPCWNLWKFKQQFLGPNCYNLGIHGDSQKNESKDWLPSKIIISSFESHHLW